MAAATIFLARAKLSPKRLITISTVTCSEGSSPPAVVIGDDGQSRVAKLRLARQKRFGRACHADDIRRGRNRAKRNFRRAIRAAALRRRRKSRRRAKPRLLSRRRSPMIRRESGKRIAPIDTCATKPSPKNVDSRRPRVKSKYCDGQTKSPGCISSRKLPQAETAKTCARSGRFERPHIGAIIDFGRQELMIFAVSRQKQNFAAVGRTANGQSRRRRPERRFDFAPLRRLRSRRLHKSRCRR